MEAVLKSLAYPDPYMILGFVFLLALDLISGIRKAKNNGEATKSRGLRKTVDKSLTYLTLVLALTVILNIIIIAKRDWGLTWTFGFTINSVLFGCAWIELISIFENLIEINTKDGYKNTLCERILRPIHKFLVLNFSSIKI